MKYEKHRKLLLDDILASMARLPSSKRSLRSYRLSSEEHIQMLTALVLQLIQCMVVLPQNMKQVHFKFMYMAEYSYNVSRKWCVEGGECSFQIINGL